MAEQQTGRGSAAGPGQAPGMGLGSGGAALLAFERVAAVGQARRIREAGAAGVEHAAELDAALEEASVAAAGMSAALPGGLVSGSALAECAALLARRARDLAAEADRTAEGMARAAGLLASVDEEVAHRVADAG